ncbi:hypothetical protein [Natrinema caseinilyticum]|uniref:hypothetical protein n=1 Tax=Natrinema caseinilyticum TaxID=2961570 RepID=UPI0020C2C5B0|nr:hypothetical protein [Natrinema caseinilyticum]
MDRSGFVKLSLVAFGLVTVSFVVRGLTRIFFEVELANLVQAPLAVVGFGLLVYLFVRACLDAVGIWKVENPDA